MKECDVAATINTGKKITITCLLMLFVASAGCATVPPQVAITHQKQLEIIQSLEKSHLAMVDSFIDQKLQNFEHFFFQNYGPVYFDHWMKEFEIVKNRSYNPAIDFPILYSDLVAEYQAEVAPIDALRVQLRDAIETEYRNAISAHNAVGGWLNNLEKLNVTQRQAINDLLGTIQPMLSLDSIDKAIETAKQKINNRISMLSNED